MGARDLLARAAEAGLDVTAAGDALVIRPAAKLTEGMRRALTQAKPELLALLAQRNRTYRLPPAEADAAHAQPWDEATIARFVARVGLFLRRGFNATGADDLAERLVLRDLQTDDRVCCAECVHFRPARCGNHRGAGLLGAELGLDLAATLQRCPGFEAV